MPELFQKGKDYLVVRHRIDRDFFLVVLNHKLLPVVEKEFPGKVCYSVHELRILRDAKLDMKKLKTVHAIKREFPGSSVDGILQKAEVEAWGFATEQEEAPRARRKTARKRRKGKNV